MGVITILLTFVYFNLFGSQQRVNLDITISILVNDLKNQQNKAISGSTDNRTSYDSYGIYFQSDKYILFHGPNLKLGDTSNFVINLNQGTTFSQVNLPDSQVVFASSSGEIAYFNPSQNTVTISASGSNQQKTITFNRYGVVISVD